MKSNMGSIDRALRIIVGLVLLGLALTSVVGWWGAGSVLYLLLRVH